MPVPLVRYREMGWLRRVSTTPAPPSRLLAAQLILNLVIALASSLIIIFGSALVFGAPLAPSQTIASGLSGGLFFLLLFLSGLWLQPVIAGEPLATIMYYSPSG